MEASQKASSLNCFLSCCVFSTRGSISYTRKQYGSTALSLPGWDLRLDTFSHMHLGAFVMAQWNQAWTFWPSFQKVCLAESQQRSSPKEHHKWSSMVEAHEQGLFFFSWKWGLHQHEMNHKQFEIAANCCTKHSGFWEKATKNNLLNSEHIPLIRERARLGKYMILVVLFSLSFSKIYF